MGSPSLHTPPPPPPSNFIVFSSIITKFCALKKYDMLFLKSAKKFTCIFCFRLMYPLKLWNFSFLDGYGRNLAQKVNSRGLIPNLKQYLHVLNKTYIFVCCLYTYTEIQPRTAEGKFQWANSKSETILTCFEQNLHFCMLSIYTLLQNKRWR